MENKAPIDIWIRCNSEGQVCVLGGDPKDPDFTHYRQINHYPVYSGSEIVGFTVHGDFVEVPRKSVLAYVIRYKDGSYYRSKNDEGTGYSRVVAHRWLPCDHYEAKKKAFYIEGATVVPIYKKEKR